MADLGETFNAQAVPPSERNFDVIPRNTWVRAHIVESDLVATKEGTGKRITLTWEILEGPYKNRKCWQGINYKNNNAQAQSIGQRELADICQAIGIPPISNTSLIEFKPMDVKLGIEKDDAEKNRVLAVAPYGTKTGGAGAHQVAPTQPYSGGAPQTNPAPAQQTPAPAQAQAGAMPWNR